MPSENMPENAPEENAIENTPDNVKKIVDMFFGKEKHYEWEMHYHYNGKKHFNGEKHYNGEFKSNCDKDYIIKEAQLVINNFIKKECEKKGKTGLYSCGASSEFPKRKFSIDTIINIILLGSMATLLFFVIRIILSF